MNTKTYQKPSVNQSIELLDLISNRYSPRAFDNKPLSNSQINLLLEAASWAPSSMNIQPWRFKVTARGTSSFEGLWNTLMEGNKPWAKDAALLIATGISVDQNKPSTQLTAAHDLGLAVNNLTLQAESMNIGVHQMGGFSKEAVIELLDLDATILPMTILAVGFYGHPDQLSEPFKSRETSVRTRKDLKDILI